MVFGADRMLFSADYPFSDSSQAVAFLRDAPLSSADKQKIAHGCQFRSKTEQVLPVEK